MTLLTTLCASALLAAAPQGTITITTTSPQAADAYVEAFDQLFAGHVDGKRTGDF